MECGVSAAVTPKVDRITTHVGAHTRHEHNTSSTLRDHVARSLARSEECTVDVDVIQTLYPVEGVAVEGRGGKADVSVGGARQERRSAVTHSKAE